MQKVHVFLDSKNTWFLFQPSENKIILFNIEVENEKKKLYQTEL